jgi:uncharacterized protein DUF5681
MSSGKRGSDHCSKPRRARKAGETPVGPRALLSDVKYRVGPGHPPREFQFKPGQSGNPKGAEPKSKLLRDLRVLYERAMNTKVKLPRGERDVLITKLEAGFNELASQFAEGDHRARRDVFDFAAKLGIDLTKSRGNNGRQVDVSSDELRQALLDRGIPARLLPPIDNAGIDPPPDPPLPGDSEGEPER